jgi:hypothetical protein
MIKSIVVAVAFASHVEELQRLAVGGVWLKKPALLWIALVLSAPIGFTERQTPAEAGV